MKLTLILGGLLGAPVVEKSTAGVDRLRHHSIQPWSAGDLFPAIIGRIERYRAEDAARMHADSTSATVTRCPGCAICADPSTSWELLLDGHTEEYASYDDAAGVARALLADAGLRARWSHKVAA